MNFEKTMCDRLGYKYKYVFENVLYAIHHLPYVKEYINEDTLKLLEELDLKINTGEIEIIEFTRPVYKYLDVDEIVKENKELKNEKDMFYKISQERLNKWLSLNDENNKLVEIIKDYKSRVEKAVEILKDTNVDMPSTLLIETIDNGINILNSRGSDE